MLPFSRYPPLRAYLRAVRDVVFTTAPDRPRITLVMGNPSADLDSFISAIVFSYFYNHTATNRNTVFVPLLNMPKTPSSELWRLRPEFGVALQQACNPPLGNSSTKQSGSDLEELLSEVLTIKDLLDGESTRLDLLHVFRPDLAESSEQHQAIVLVDHNAPSTTVPKVPSSAIIDQLDIVGCIDHHVEENTVPQSASPRIITTGIGSCTTLVVSHLRKSGLWPKALDDAQNQAIQEVVRLALAPILVDTHNLKAKGEKCSDLDRDIVAALEVELGSTAMLGIKSSWNRDAFYELVAEAKSDSLELLKPREMFERDYKSWIEGRIEIGISSLVQPIPWLVEKAGGAKGLASEMKRYAEQMQEEQTAEGVRFEVFLLLTPGTKMGKEVVMVTFSETAAKAIEVFEQKAGSLGLEKWDGDGNEEVLKSLRQEFGEGNFKIWWMTQRDKTRKQGAPLVRDAVAAVQT